MNTVIITFNKNFTAQNATNIINLSNFSIDFLNASNLTKSTNFLVDDGFETCMFFHGKYGMSENTKYLVNGFIETLGPLIGFVIPILVISFCYVNIVSTVRRKTMETSSRAPVGRVTKLSTIIVIAFILCWTPQKVLNIWSAFCGWLDLCPFDETAYNRVYPFCLVLAWTNSIMNPILYALKTPVVRKNLVELFSFLKRRLIFCSIGSLSVKSFPRTDSTRMHGNNLRPQLFSCAKQQKLQILEGESTVAETLVLIPEYARSSHATTKFSTPGDASCSMERFKKLADFIGNF